jgi:uridine phosphorylase
VFWDGPVLVGEDGSEDLPVRFGAAAVCRRGIGGQVAAVVGTGVVVAKGEASSAEGVASADESVNFPAIGPPALWLSWLVLVRCEGM